MSDQKIELPLTAQALAGLSEALASLSSDLAAKKNELKAAAEAKDNQIQAQEKKLEILQVSTTDTLETLDQIIAQLDKVLDNGTSYHHN